MTWYCVDYVFDLVISLNSTAVIELVHYMSETWFVGLGPLLITFPLSDLVVVSDGSGSNHFGKDVQVLRSVN